MQHRQEIMLIRAALQFWYEEMDLEDADLFAIYSGGPRIKPPWVNGMPPKFPPK